MFKKINITSEIGPINLGAVFRDTIEARLGAVVHNYQGQILASLSKKVRLPPSRDVVKALAVAKLSSLLMNIFFSSVILEGDLEAVIKAMRSEDESFATFGHLLSSIKPTKDSFCVISFFS